MLLILVGGWEKLVKGTWETLTGKGAHTCILHPGARQNLPHSSRTRVSHNTQYSGTSFPKKSYFSKFHACSKTWAWVLGCAVQDSLDPKPRGLWAEMSTAFLSSFKFNVFRALAKLGSAILKVLRATCRLIPQSLSPSSDSP